VVGARRAWPALAISILLSCSPLEEGGPRGDVTFGVVGDAPYRWWEEGQFDYLMEVLDRDSLDMLVHVGDLFWRPCSGDRMRNRLNRLLAQRHPVLYTPGDNDWTDCWGRAEGGYEPLERLDTLRSVFFPQPGMTTGSGGGFEMDYQGSRPEWSEFVENTRWTMADALFMTVHIVGSWNGFAEFDGRSAADDEAARRRTEAAAAWLAEGFAEARESEAKAVVIFTHSFPDEATYSAPHREAFEPYLQTLEEEVAAYSAPVVLVHGDHHDYTVDQPLADRRTGRTLDNFTRLQTMGSPQVGWVRVTITFADGEARFDYSPRVVSGLRF